MNAFPLDPQEKFDDRLHFEMLLTELSARFVSVTPETINSEILNAQRQIGEALELERSTLFRVESDGRYEVTHSWQVPGLAPFPGFLAQDIPWISSRVLGGKEVCWERLDDLPVEAAREKEIGRRFGPRSSFTSPLRVGGKIIGAISFGTVHRERKWPEAVVNRLRLFVEMIGSAMARTQAESATREALAEVRRLRDQLQRENAYLQQEVKTVHGRAGLVGESAVLRHVLEQAEQVADTTATVLLIGETGTGKELIASAIHEHSLRSARPMVRVSCAAIPATLIESELFGREKGAYTGAMSRQVGRFELAHGSTLFLDEVGELPLEVQVKLLRVLQERQVERLGSNKSIAVDVRIIAATNRDLEKAVREKTFRDDLYYRLNVFPIRMPPLRERVEDIPLLVKSFVNEFAISFGKGIESIDPAGIEALQGYAWPGNVRELRNTVERAVILAKGPHLRLIPPNGPPAETRASQLHSDVEREHIRSVMEKTGWRVRGKDGAAEILGLKPTTLDSMLVRLGLSRKTNRVTP